MKIMERCIEESLRLYPSVPYITRITDDEGFTTNSVHYIPKGINVSIFICGLHRSKQFWENPEKFDPDRFLPDNSVNRHSFAYTPLSTGPRNCIGKKLFFSYNYELFKQLGKLFF